MAYMGLSVTAPTGTTYDSENPTQGTEELNMTLHAILQDMEDAGPWYLWDNYNVTAQKTPFQQGVRDIVKNVFDYATQAITDYRDGDPISIEEPTYTSIAAPTSFTSSSMNDAIITLWAQAMKLKYLIYYMWKTETDPIRVKDYIRDMLLAWPLQDITIDLADDGGNQIRVHPLSHLTET